MVRPKGTRKNDENEKRENANTSKIRKKNAAEIKIPSKVSTDVAISGLTFAFASLEMTSVNPNLLLIEHYQKDNQDKPHLIAKVLRDQNGRIEEVKTKINGRWILIKPTKKGIVEELVNNPIEINTVEKAQKIIDEVGISFEEFFSNSHIHFQNAFEKAAEVLYLTIFLERICRLDKAQNVVDFCYTLVRSVEYLPNLKHFVKDLESKAGKNWRWMVAWEIALLDKKVKQFWDDKEKLGLAYLQEWKKLCKKQAINNWGFRKKKLENLEDGALQLRSNFLKSFL